MQRRWKANDDHSISSSIRSCYLIYSCSKTEIPFLNSPDFLHCYAYGIGGVANNNNNNTQIIKSSQVSGGRPTKNKTLKYLGYPNAQPHAELRRYVQSKQLQ